jgi:hypothetical protein
MAKSKVRPTTSAQAAPGLLAFRAHLSGGNASTPAESDGQRIALERLLRWIQQTLETQFQRTADLQAQVDRLQSQVQPPRT